MQTTAGEILALTTILVPMVKSLFRKTEKCIWVWTFSFVVFENGKKHIAERLKNEEKAYVQEGLGECKRRLGRFWL